MASLENQQHTFPDPVPPFISAGDHEMRDYYTVQDAPRPPPQQNAYLTPYLGLRARLSQTWINKWTILLLLVLVRMLFALASLDDNLGAARKQALSACTSVENVGSAMASMPHYMSQGINTLTANGIEKAIDGLMEMLLLSVTAVEEIVLFIINLLTQTYVCLITLAISGSLHVAVQVAEDVGNALNATIKNVGKDLGGAATDFENGMNSFLADLDKIASVLSGKKLTPPTIDLTGEIKTLDSVQLPTGYDQGLSTLNNSIPTFAEVNNFTTWAIKLPFEEVKKLLNHSLPDYRQNASIFPVPDKEQLSFCSHGGGVNAFFDDLIRVKTWILKVSLIVLVILAVLAMVPMAYREIRRWKFMKERARLIQDKSNDPMDSVYLASRPYTSTAGLVLARSFSSSRRQILVRWTVAYATTPAALFVLMLALTGLLSSLCQYVAFRAMEKAVPDIENDVIGFTDKVISSLNNASEQWAIGTNDVINQTNVRINRDVFGWVNSTTTAVNNTLNIFVDDMVGVLNKTFGGTVLYTPILDVLNCLVLLKIQGIEHGLTWVSDHAHIVLPLLSKDTFSLGTIAKISDPSDPQASFLNAGPNGGAAQDIADAVYHLTNVMIKAIRQEAIIATCLLLIWVFIVLVGICWALFFMPGCAESGMRRGSRHACHGITPTGGENHELDVNAAPAPTYEQATEQSHVAHAGDNAANKYKGQVYTLAPSPMPPAMEAHGSSPILNTGYSNEKLGSVNGQYVDTAIRRPTHVRASSHGDYHLTSPATPCPPAIISSWSPPVANPFLDPPNHQDSFADPRR